MLTFVLLAINVTLALNQINEARGFSIRIKIYYKKYHFFIKNGFGAY